ncbi:HAD family hydrolase [Lutimonas sp.]|uniref:HAD family hydrolase n=1 Tax=Lutimonas sp. TaxID=1872403 RepID=UPI003D9BD6E7
MTIKSQKNLRDAIIFDMDGTLWDAVATYTLAWNEYFKKQGMDTVLSKADLDALMGLEEAQFLEKVLPEMTSESRKSCYQEVIELQYDLIDEIGGRIYPGVKEYLEKLSNYYKLFIVSNCPKDTIKHFMKFAQIEHLITDSLAHGQNYKAKHENISSLVHSYHLKNPVYVGDTHGDMLQSRIASVPFVFMSYGFGACDDFDRSFASFEAFALYYLNA